MVFNIGRKSGGFIDENQSSTGPMGFWRGTGIPVVALTASGSDETRKRALTTGFIAYLVSRPLCIDGFP